MDYLSVGQVAKLLDCSPYHVNALAAAGKIVSHRLQERGWNRIKRDSVIEYANKLGIELHWERLENNPQTRNHHENSTS
jgi:excisionase family DNA binding protein